MRSTLWLITIAATFVACSGKHRPITPDPEALADAADSARIAVWQPEEARGDTLHHSRFYTGALSYIRESIDVERDKRLVGEGISSLTPLSIQHLKSNRYRAMAMDSLSKFSFHDSLWNARLNSIFADYSRFALATLDSLYTDSLRYRRTLPEILRRDLFYPHWRPAYDSVERAIVAHTLDVLRLVDTNSRQIRFEEDLRFDDPETADSYDALRKALDSLGIEEERLNRSH